MKITAKQLASELAAPALPAPTAPASAGSQQAAPAASSATATKTKPRPRPRTAATTKPASDTVTQQITSQFPAASATAPQQKITLPTKIAAPATPAAPQQTVATPMVKERLFANPKRPASFAAGGRLQVVTAASATPQISSFRNYFSDVLHLGRSQYTLEPLKAGAVVVAGTIFGRIAAGTPQQASHVQFMVQPAGKNAPQIDPKPILDGWKLLEATAVYRAAGVDPFFGPGAKNASIGQILLMSKEQLQNRIAAGPARADLQLRPARHPRRADRPARARDDRIPLRLRS